MNGHAITLEEVHEIAKECNIEFKHGDIFFLRCGFTKTWESISLDQKKEYRALTQAHKHRHTGLIQSEAVAKFMWDNHIVAVAGELILLECLLLHAYISQATASHSKCVPTATTSGPCTTTALPAGVFPLVRCSTSSAWRSCARSSTDGRSSSPRAPSTTRAPCRLHPTSWHSSRGCFNVGSNDSAVDVVLVEVIKLLYSSLKTPHRLWKTLPGRWNRRSNNAMTPLACSTLNPTQRHPHSPPSRQP